MAKERAIKREVLEKVLNMIQVNNSNGRETTVADLAALFPDEVEVGLFQTGELEDGRKLWGFGRMKSLTTEANAAIENTTVAYCGDAYYTMGFESIENCASAIAFNQAR